MMDNTMDKPQPTLDLPPFIPPKREKRRSYLTILLTAFVLVLFGLVIAASYQNMLLTKDTEMNIMNTPLAVPTMTLETANEIGVDTTSKANWKTYTNSLHRYKIRYPQTWVAKGIRGDAPAEIVDQSNVNWLELSNTNSIDGAAVDYVTILGRNSIPEYMLSWEKTETTLNTLPAIFLTSRSSSVINQAYLVKNAENKIILEIKYSYEEGADTTDIDEILQTIELY
jgi:hypothetical protein